METIEFKIIKFGDDMGTIVTDDSREIYQDIADGFIVFTCNELIFEEMENIRDKVAKLGNRASFVFK